MEKLLKKITLKKNPLAENFPLNSSLSPLPTRFLYPSLLNTYKNTFEWTEGTVEKSFLTAEIHIGYNQVFLNCSVGSNFFNLFSSKV